MRLVVAIGLAALILAPSLTAQAVGPHLLVRIVNDGDDIVARLIAWRGDQTPFFDESVRLPGSGRQTLVAIDARPGEYSVRLELQPRTVDAASTPLDARVPLEMQADSHGCPGPYALAFAFSMNSYVSVSPVGCLVPTDGFTALLAEASSARHGFPRATIHVPLPGVADRGVYDYGGEMPFEWRGDAQWLDAWGRDARGAEVTYKNNFGGGKGSGSAFGLGGWAFAHASGSMEILRFAAGEFAPSSWTRTEPRFADGGPAAVAAALAREVRYDEARLDAACYLRHGLQGHNVRAGDDISAEEICAHWTGALWRAAAPIEWKGSSAMPLYRTEESAERTLAERVLLVEGVPYVVDHARFVLPSGEGVRERSTSLERLELRGDPIDANAVSLPPSTTRLAPLDPLRGPALSDRTRIGFTLHEASDAALSDPLLSRVREVAAMPESVLAGAMYADQREGGAPVGRETWFLMFRAGDELAYAACERPALPLPIAPPLRCFVPSGQQMSLYGWSEPLWSVPPMKRVDLPSHAPTFDDALARWDALRPGGPSPRATFALYRAWADAETGEPAVLAVGISPQEGLAPSSEPTTGDYAALKLDGSTFAAVELTQTQAVFAPADLPAFGEATLRAEAPRAAFASDLPYLAGGGAVALGLLVALAIIFYSRLARSRVLDDETRARIYAAVEREPGLHASAILERLGKHSGVGEYHLGVLVRERFLTCVTTPGFRRYFVPGRFDPMRMRAIAALREGQNEKLFGIIRASPGIQLSQLAEVASMSLPYASKGVARLVEAGLVDKVQVGRAVALHALETANAAPS